jgi:type IV pilus assembly protein PilZ
MTVVCKPRDGRPFAGVVRDLGVGGAFIECIEALPFGTEVLIIGQLPPSGADLRLPSVVRWTKPDGFGVQFGLLGARETHAISVLLSAERQ